MQFANCTVDDVNDAIEVANREHGYDLSFAYTSGNGSRFRGRFIPETSRSHGSRISPDGRRIKAACWHAHRDVLAVLFEIKPDAKVTTEMAKYHGREMFRAAFPATEYRNVGSACRPASYGDLCDCA
jgi:hypothetical protein